MTKTFKAITASALTIMIFVFGFQAVKAGDEVFVGPKQHLQVIADPAPQNDNWILDGHELNANPQTLFPLDLRVFAPDTYRALRVGGNFHGKVQIQSYSWRDGLRNEVVLVNNNFVETKWPVAAIRKVILPAGVQGQFVSIGYANKFGLQERLDQFQQNLITVDRFHLGDNNEITVARDREMELNPEFETFRIRDHQPDGQTSYHIHYYIDRNR